MVVRHKLTGKILTVKKDYGRVVVCKVPPGEEVTIWCNMIVDIVICDKKNLEYIDSFEIKFAQSENLITFVKIIKNAYE